MNKKMQLVLVLNMIGLENDTLPSFLDQQESKKKPKQFKITCYIQLKITNFNKYYLKISLLSNLDLQLQWKHIFSLYLKKLAN